MARLTKAQVSRWASNPIQTQKEQLSYLVKNASKTSFGQIHTFSKIKNYNDFKNHVPVRDYEELREYFDKIKEGKNNILWPGKPLYLAVTSGTTSGSKYIPITKQSLPTSKMTIGSENKVGFLKTFKFFSMTIAAFFFDN